MEDAIEYRSLAAQMRREAQAAVLPRVKEMKLAAAHKWDCMAEEVERVTHCALSNPQERAAWVF